MIDSETLDSPDDEILADYQSNVQSDEVSTTNASNELGRKETAALPQRIAEAFAFPLANR